MSLDHTGNYVYCSCLEDSIFFVIDGRHDSIIAMVRLPTHPVGPFLLNDLTDRMYVAQYGPHHGSWLPVIRDSMMVGVEEARPQSPMTVELPTAYLRGLSLYVSALAELCDASGRRAAVLLPGPNNIGYLAAGVYFVTEARTGTRSQTSRKIVIAR
jgi:hypothetical protein